jgi:tRNA uridine 5-carboxymethylaminomethyl modification enzyme
VGVGPRYCPSIEDKVVKFPDRPRHHIYLEPEGRRTHWVYPNGISTSLPTDVQEQIVHSIPGLQEAKILQWAYAIEYDFFPPIQIRPTFETKAVAGLYLAGQICGTSGYEEAAGQGLLAGINAVRALRGEEPFLLDRGEAYLGVLVDDLCVLSPREPYRMFTSSAEFRLLLRHDNADLRLMARGAELGLIPREASDRVTRKARAIHGMIETLRGTWREGRNALRLLRRPGTSLADLEPLVPELAELDPAVREEVEIEGKYGGYIERQRREVDRMRRWERKRLPADFNYAAIRAMRREAREKLCAVKPVSIAQARRIAGVRPADVAVLLVHLKTAGLVREEEEE